MRYVVFVFFWFTNVLVNMDCEYFIIKSVTAVFCQKIGEAHVCPEYIWSEMMTYRILKLLNMH